MREPNARRCLRLGSLVALSPAFCSGRTQDILSNFVDPLGLAIDLTEELEDELVMPSVEDVKRKYFWLYNEPLENALMAATAGSGAFGQLLLAMSTTVPPSWLLCH